MKIEYSVFKEGPKWAAQALDMDDDENVVHYRTRDTRPEAQALVDQWRSTDKAGYPNNESKDMAKKCKECGANLETTGRNTPYCPDCDACPECKCPGVDGFSHYQGCTMNKNEESIQSKAHQLIKMLLGECDTCEPRDEKFTMHSREYEAKVFDNTSSGAINGWLSKNKGWGVLATQGPKTYVSRLNDLGRKNAHESIDPNSCYYCHKPSSPGMTTVKIDADPKYPGMGPQPDIQYVEVCATCAEQLRQGKTPEIPGHASTTIPDGWTFDRVGNSPQESIQAKAVQVIKALMEGEWHDEYSYRLSHGDAPDTHENEPIYDGPDEPDRPPTCHYCHQPSEEMTTTRVDTDPGDPEVGPQPDIQDVWVCPDCLSEIKMGRKPADTHEEDERSPSPWSRSLRHMMGSHDN